MVKHYNTLPKPKIMQHACVREHFLDCYRVGNSLARASCTLQVHDVGS
jgi:hypothetical protein